MLTGNLGRDPQPSTTADGRAISRFTLAVNHRVKSAGGDQQETDWYNISAWDTNADFCRSYLKKGHRVLVEGRIRQRRYTDRGGVPRVALDVNVDSLEILTPKEASEGAIVQPPLPMGEELATADIPEELDEIPLALQAS